MYTCQSDVCCMTLLSFKWSEAVYSVPHLWVVNAQTNVQFNFLWILESVTEIPTKWSCLGHNSLWQESSLSHSSGQKCFRKTLLPTRLSWHRPCLEASKLKDLGFVEVTDCRELVWNLSLLSVSCHSANLLLHINKVCHLICSSKACHATMVFAL